MYDFPSNDFSWAADVLREIDQGHARGNRLALVIRAKLQAVLFRLGCLAQRHCGKAVLFGFLIMVLFSIGLTRAKLETNAENLWIEVGGRLEKELAYTKASLGEGSGGTNEVMIQTPNIKGTNILSVKALKEHLDAMVKASQVTVDIFDQTWSLKDICYTLSLPPFNNAFLDNLIPQILPCVFVTPLDCFWEGSKALGNNVTFGNIDLKWTSLNPRNLMLHLQGFLPSLADEKVNGLLDEAGITTGYTAKPCLDPYDPECPATAPNFITKKKPDIGVEVTGGCQGFASKFLDWPEELIIGGVMKNRSGTIRSAEALQSTILLMGTQQLHAHLYAKAKVNHLDWTEDLASKVLEAWKREFTKTINSEADGYGETTVLAFSSTSFNDLLQDFSQTSYTKLAIGYVLMLIYACLTLKHWNYGIHSHAALGFAGVLLVTLAVASGLGLCSFVGLKFNAASTQVLPFLALGLGVDDMFLLAHTYVTLAERGDIQRKEQAGYCLASMGVSVFITSFTNMFAFFMAALIPIPALRSFSLQAAIVVVFNFFAVIGIFPAMIGIDISRRNDQRYDILCCLQKTVPDRISIMPSTSVDNSLVLQHWYHNSCSSLSSSSAAMQGLGTTMILPGTVQASASAQKTIHLPGVVTLQASALAELGNAPVVYKHSKRPMGKRVDRQANESNEFQLSATGNVCSGDGTCSSRTRAGASANVGCSGGHGLLQVHVAGSSATEHKFSADSQLRPEHNQPRSKASETQHDRTQSDTCTCSVSAPEGRNKRHAWRNHSRDSVVNENALYHTSRGEHVRRTRSQSHAQGNAPRNVHIQLSANAASNGETAQAAAECLSITESVRMPSSRSSPGLESAGSKSTSPSSSACPDPGSCTKWHLFTKRVGHLSLTYFSKEHYGPWLQKMPVKISVLFVFAGLFATGLYGCMKVEEGLDLTDVVPRRSQEHKFVEAQFKYFSFHQMFVITKGDFDYPNSQELLYKLHEAFKKIPNVIKTPEAELPPFWLTYFRDWLLTLQAAFDRDWELGTITYSGWQKNASDNGVMAFKLLAQTGEKETNNKSIVRNVRLVNDDGIIRPETFYQYLMVWNSIDYLGYTFSQANIRPEPDGSWYNRRSDQRSSHAMRVEPPALPINFSKVPFYLNNLRETKDFIETIKGVRAICDEFTEAGLPNYPSGIPFTFWEQYIWLGEHLLIAVAIVLSASFVVMAVILCNCWAAMLIVIVLLMITVEVYGFMGLAGIKLSAVPAVTLILSVGVGVEFTVHMCMAFLSAVGDRNQRMQKAIEDVFSPVVDGAMSTLLGVVMLAGSDFDFIVRYFFHLLAALIVIGSTNGLMFLPVLLSLVGPAPEVEEVVPPGTTGSAGSNRELLPSSACRQRTPPADSELCILESVERQDETASRSRERRTRPGRGPQKGNSRGRSKTNLSKTPPKVAVDSDSSSSTVTRVTARATVTVEVHTQQVTAGDRMYPNFRGGTQVEPIHSEGEANDEGLEELDKEIKK